ncbi:MAG TPA: hypothetical protein VF846_02495 [Thermoanaerobaculia bacterium]|jgi:hypothetical protein
MQKPIVSRIHPPDSLPPAASLERYVPLAAVAAAVCTLLLIFLGRV